MAGNMNQSFEWLELVIYIYTEREERELHDVVYD